MFVLNTNPFENNITSTSATLNWDATPTGAWGYRIQYLAMEHRLILKLLYIKCKLVRYFNLTPSTTYKWRVKAVSDASGSNISLETVAVLHNTIRN